MGDGADHPLPDEFHPQGGAFGAAGGAEPPLFAGEGDVLLPSVFDLVNVFPVGNDSDVDDPGFGINAIYGTVVAYPDPVDTRAFQFDRPGREGVPGESAKRLQDLLADGLEQLF